MCFADDGRTIIYVLGDDARYGADDVPSPWQALTIYRDGIQIASYTTEEVTGCDLARERCSAAVSVLELLSETAIKAAAPLFTDGERVYLVDSKNQAHVFSLLTGERLPSEPSDMLLPRVQAARKAQKVEVTVTPSLYLPQLRLLDGRAIETAAEFLGMVADDPLTEANAHRNRRLYLHEPLVEGLLHRDGRFVVTGGWSRSSRVSVERMREFAEGIRVDASLLTGPFEQWRVTLYFLAFRDRDPRVARREQLEDEANERRRTAEIAVAEKIDGVYIPLDLGDALGTLDKLLSPVIKDELRALVSRDEMPGLHLTLGMYIRNTFGLWAGSRLAQYFIRLGVTQPESMSGVILVHYYDWLHGRNEPWREWERQQAAANARATKGRPILALAAQYGAPLRSSGAVFSFIPIGKPGRHEQDGLMLHAAAGESGFKIGAGPALASGYFGLLEMAGTITRTTREPKRMSANSTYVGIE